MKRHLTITAICFFIIYIIIITVSAIPGNILLKASGLSQPFATAITEVVVILLWWIFDCSYLKSGITLQTTRN
jgi:hypothetical protein